MLQPGYRRHWSVSFRFQLQRIYIHSPISIDPGLAPASKSVVVSIDAGFNNTSFHLSKLAHLKQAAGPHVKWSVLSGVSPAWILCMFIYIQTLYVRISLTIWPDSGADVVEVAPSYDHGTDLFYFKFCISPFRYPEPPKLIDANNVHSGNHGNRSRRYHSWLLWNDAYWLSPGLIGTPRFFWVQGWAVERNKICQNGKSMHRIRRFTSVSWQIGKKFRHWQVIY